MSLSRRRFLKRVSAALAGPLALGAAGCEGEGGPPEGWVKAGPLAGLDPDRYAPRRVRMVPELDGGYLATVYLRRARAGSETVVALSDRCTHLGCPVRFVAASRRFVCPCHGGVFGFRGGRLGGPPQRDLDRYPAEVHDGQVYLGPRIRSRGPAGPAGV